MRFYDVLVLLEQHAHAKPNLCASFMRHDKYRTKQIAHVFSGCMSEQTSVERPEGRNTVCDEFEKWGSWTNALERRDDGCYASTVGDGTWKWKWDHWHQRPRSSFRSCFESPVLVRQEDNRSFCITVRARARY